MRQTPTAKNLTLLDVHVKAKWGAKLNVIIIIIIIIIMPVLILKLRLEFGGISHAASLFSFLTCMKAFCTSASSLAKRSHQTTIRLTLYHQITSSHISSVRPTIGEEVPGPDTFRMCRFVSQALVVVTRVLNFILHPFPPLPTSA